MDEILLQRIFDKLDSMDAKISDLCNRMTKSEVYHEDNQILGLMRKIIINGVGRNYLDLLES